MIKNIHASETALVTKSLNEGAASRKQTEGLNKELVCVYIYIFEFNFQPIALRCVWFQVLNENWILNRASDQPGMAGIEPIFGIEFIGPSNSQCTL